MTIEVIPVEGLPEVVPGDDLGRVLAAAAGLQDGDVLVVTQKVVSKAEGRLVDVDPSDEAARAALVESEAVRIVRRRGDLIIAETRHGFVCANAGVDVGVVISDTFGRPWRRGLVDVAIGCAGVAAVVDLRGGVDARGRELQVTEVAVADELAAAAELVMGKAAGIPAAIVRGVDRAWLRRASVRDEIVRPPDEDLFR